MENNRQQYDTYKFSSPTYRYTCGNPGTQHVTHPQCQSGQPIHVGQLDTSHFTGIAGGTLVLNLNTSYLETAHATGLTVKSASLVDELVSSSASLSIAKLAKFIKVGSYTGDNAAGRGITGVGFQPDFVMIFPDYSQGGHRAVVRTADMTCTRSIEDMYCRQPINASSFLRALQVLWDYLEYGRISFKKRSSKKPAGIGDAEKMSIR